MSDNMNINYNKNNINSTSIIDCFLTVSIYLCHINNFKI